MAKEKTLYSRNANLYPKSTSFGRVTKKMKIFYDAINVGVLI